MIITDYKRNHSQKTTVSLKYSIWPRLNFSVSFSFFSNLYLPMKVRLFPFFGRYKFADHVWKHVVYLCMLTHKHNWWHLLHNSVMEPINYSWNKKNSKNWHTASKTMLWVSNNEGKMYWPLYSEYIYIYKFANSLC